MGRSRRRINDGAVTNEAEKFMIYKCGCGDTFMIEGFQVSELIKHRKTCSHTIKDPKNFDKFKSLYQTKKAKDIVQGFYIQRGSIDSIVEWLDEYYSKMFIRENKDPYKVDVKILDFFKKNLKSIKPNEVRKNLEGFYGRPLSDDS